MTNRLPDWSAPYCELTEDIFYKKVSPSPLSQPCWVDINYALAVEVGGPIDLTDQKSYRHFLAVSRSPSGVQLRRYTVGTSSGSGLVSLETAAAFILACQAATSGTSRAVARPHTRAQATGVPCYVARSVNTLALSTFTHWGFLRARALALVTSDTPVQRETMERGASLMRLAKSHLRIGHLEHFYHRHDHEHLREMIEFAIHQLDPDLIDSPDRIEKAFQRYIERSAQLMGNWMAVGFVHGVMNTDNTALSGETLDYGPYGFLTSYRDDYVINHTDHTGPLCLRQQPRVMYWNMSCLAETLTPFVRVDTLRASLDRFPGLYETAYRTQMANRLALESRQ